MGKKTRSILDLDEGSIKLISQRTYPSFETLEKMEDTVNSLDDQTVKRLLITVLSCGFRIGEVLNSYFYMSRGVLRIRGIAEKKPKVTQFVMPRRGYLGEMFLKANLQSPIWKSVEVKPLFPKLAREWINDYISPHIFQPIFPFAGLTYSKAYRLIKKTPKIQCFYFPTSTWLEEPLVEEFAPSYHFYRKAFVAEATKEFPDILSVMNYMKWEKFETMLRYWRLYRDKDLKAGFQGLDTL